METEFGKEGLETVINMKVIMYKIKRKDTEFFVGKMAIFIKGIS